MTCLNLLDMQKSHMLRFFLKVESEGCPNILVIFLQIRKTSYWLLNPHFSEVFLYEINFNIQPNISGSGLFCEKSCKIYYNMSNANCKQLLLIYYFWVLSWMNKKGDKWTHADKIAPYKCEKNEWPSQTNTWSEP